MTARKPTKLASLRVSLIRKKGERDCTAKAASQPINYGFTSLDTFDEAMKKVKR